MTLKSSEGCVRIGIGEGPDTVNGAGLCLPLGDGRLLGISIRVRLTVVISAGVSCGAGLSGRFTGTPDAGTGIGPAITGGDVGVRAASVRED